MNWKRLLFVIVLSTGFMVKAQVSEETSQVSELKEMVETEEEPVYRNVEFMARYRGGYEVLLKQVEAATKNCKKGKIKSKNKNAEIVAEVLVDKTGKVVDVQIIKADVHLCENEIISALKAAKQWIPARINNKPVNSYLQIRVNLQNSFRNDSKNAGNIMS